MSSLHFPSLVLCLCPNPHSHFLHRSSIDLFQPLPLPSASSSGLSISPRSTCSCFTSPLLFPFLVLFRPLNLARPRPSFSFSSGLYFSAPDVPPVANIVFLPPPLDMAKEAICALLAILEHFFEAFSPLDLFFALAPFRPVPRPFPDSVHLGCRRFPPLPSRFFIDSNLFHLPPVRSSQHHPGLVPIPLGDIRPCCLHLPSFCRLVSPRSRTSLRLRLPVSVRPCRPRAVRTRGVFTHRDDFGKPACVERGLVRTAMFHALADVPRTGAGDSACKYQQERRNRLTPGRGECRGGPCGMGGRSR